MPPIANPPITKNPDKSRAANSEYHELIFPYSLPINPSLMGTDHHVELLAPAGSADAAWAALHYGADAVFAGLPRFSARAEAANLTAEQLDELIGYAHAHDRKVYITFNTLVQQHELPDALEALALIHDLNADGVIVQDMGVARMVRRFFPALQLHASTQLAVHNPAGARLLKELGFSRVVLARELSLREIRTITRNCGIETEVFIHGALCYSYSGLCLFSSHLNSRSGNRGKCAYCCRMQFDHEGKAVLPFSMKDFAVGEHFDELQKTGVASLKIEGRMKKAIYVAAVTDFYRKRMDQGLNPAEQQKLLSDIQTIFGRPATDLYLKNPDTDPIDPTTNGHRGSAIGTIASVFKEHGKQWIRFTTNRALMKHDGLKIELGNSRKPFNFFVHEIRFSNDRKKQLLFSVPARSEIDIQLPPDHPFAKPGMPLYCSASQAVRQRYGFEAPRPGMYKQRKPFDAAVELSPSGIRLSAKAGKISAQRMIAEPLSEARKPEKTKEGIRRSFEKTGDTEWVLQSLNVKDLGLFAPASVLNEGRRQLLDQLSKNLKQQKRAEHFQRLEKLVRPPAEPEKEECWSVKVRDLSLLEKLTEQELSRLEVVLENAILSAPAGTEPQPSGIAIPVIQRNHDIQRPAHTFPIEAANLGTLQAFADNPDLTADWPLYTLNSEAAEQWQELGLSKLVLSPEDTAENLKALLAVLGDRAIVPVYQHTPLMISATRPKTAPHLSDRKGRSMKIETNGDQFVLIFEAPFSLTEHLDELRAAGARNFRIDLSYGVNDAEDAAEIIRRTMKGFPMPGSYDGNYRKTL
ncbi:U32 family peptidase [Verrucomicrobia bacterium S94]|nr:U32 family peptidase [Verrucomicrobia bacterium S94]